MLSNHCKRALLVGSSGLLGPTWSLALDELGLDVVRADPFDPAADFKVDLQDSGSISHFSAHLPPIDIIVLNAGIDAKLDSIGSNLAVDTFDTEQWLRFFLVNVIGQAQLIESLAPNLKPNATVIGVGSMYALVAPRKDVYNPPHSDVQFVKHPAYGASKAAFANLFRQYAVRYAGKISFNMLTLGVVGDTQPDHFRATMTPQIPTRMFLDKGKLGKHLQSLVNNPDVNFTGQNLIVDGGYTLW